MTNAKSEDNELCILNLADDAPVANAIAPERAEFFPLQRLPDAARIIQPGNALEEKTFDSAGTRAGLRDPGLPMPRRSQWE